MVATLTEKINGTPFEAISNLNDLCKPAVTLKYQLFKHNYLSITLTSISAQFGYLLYEKLTAYCRSIICQKLNLKKIQHVTIVTWICAIT